MKSGNARAIAGLVLTGLLVTGAGVFVLPDALDSRLECVRADEWVRTHAQELPSTLEEFRSLPPDYRTRIYSALRPEVKCSLWREQLSEALDHSDLSDEQREFIAQSLPLLTPEFFANHYRAPQAVEARARQLFVSHEHADIMMLLGGHVVSYRNLQVLQIRLGRGLRRLFIASASSRSLTMPPSCDCPLDQSCWGHCWVHPATGCQDCGGCGPTSDGCGFWGGCACAGRCCAEGCAACI